MDKRQRMIAISKELGSKAADVSKNVMTGIGQVFGAAVGAELVSSVGFIIRSEKEAMVLAKKLFNVHTTPFPKESLISLGYRKGRL